jgi:hypothetical protein
MRRRDQARLCVLASVLVLGACMRSAPRTARQPPQIVLAESSFDFGRVPRGTVVEHRFAVRNAGGLRLTIDKLRSACGCVAAASPAPSLRPGASGTVDVRYDTARDAGPESRSVTVYSNDPQQPVITLTLTGEVMSDIEADPAELYVGTVRRGQAAATEVRIRLAASVAPDATVVETTGAAITAQLSDVEAAPNNRRVRVEIRPDAPLGPFHDEITLRVANAQPAIVTIPVVGRVHDDGSATPGP